MRFIETVKARPIHAASVRRWRSVNMAMSSGPLIRPEMAMQSAIGRSPAGHSSSAVVPMKQVAGRRISCLSRPSVRKRPQAKAETTPKAPLRPNM